MFLFVVTFAAYPCEYSLLGVKYKKKEPFGKSFYKIS